MDMTYGWFPRGTRNPFIKEIMSHEDNTLVFDGYFYVDAMDLPVQRVMVTYDAPVKTETGYCYTAVSASHVEIYEKESGQDTSHDDETDDETAAHNCSNEENICFFPTEITTLKYRILKSNLTVIERDIIESSIKEANKALNEKKIAIMVATASASED